MKYFSVYLCMLLVALKLNTAISSPPQRLVIQFHSPLNAEQTQSLKQQINTITQADYTLLPHSTAQRWLIVVNASLDKTELEHIVKKITGLEQVKYAEPDNILKSFSNQ